LSSSLQWGLIGNNQISCGNIQSTEWIVTQVKEWRLRPRRVPRSSERRSPGAPGLAVGHSQIRIVRSSDAQSPTPHCTTLQDSVGSLSTPDTLANKRRILIYNSISWAANGLRLCGCGYRGRYAVVAGRSCRRLMFAASIAASNARANGRHDIASICIS
jgi:hypothetical protein